MNKEQGTKNKEKAVVCSMQVTRLYQVFGSSYFIFFRKVLTEEIKSRIRSLQSVIILLYSAVVKSLVSFNKSSQYSVSAHSFNAIVVLTRNSFLLTEYWASLRFAPIDVPERKSCFARVYSCFSSHKCLYRLYTLMANLRLLSSAIFIYLKILILNSKFKKKRKKLL